MERLCFTFKLYPGQEAEYKRRHDEIWPDLVEAIQQAGLRNYSLFRRGQDVVDMSSVIPTSPRPLNNCRDTRRTRAGATGSRT